MYPSIQTIQMYTVLGCRYSSVAQGLPDKCKVVNLIPGPPTPQKGNALFNHSPFLLLLLFYFFLKIPFY